MNKIARDVAEVVKEPAMQDRLHVLGIDPDGGGPREFAQALASIVRASEKIVKQAGIQPE